MGLSKYIPFELIKLYEIHDYKHAAAILSQEFPREHEDVCNALLRFRFSEKDIIVGGGSESHIPKIMSNILRPLGWSEKNLYAELSVYEVKDKKSKIFKGSLSHGSHKVDYVKGRVAFDLEWNSKDQTFDRDLYAFRAFFEYNAISVGIIVTRSTELNTTFNQLGIRQKYGASTTQMDKLIPRLEAGRNGGCPILVFGITSKLIND